MKNRLSKVIPFCSRSRSPAFRRDTLRSRRHPHRVPRSSNRESTLLGGNSAAVTHLKGLLEEEFKKDGIQVTWTFCAAQVQLPTSSMPTGSPTSRCSRPALHHR